MVEDEDERSLCHSSENTLRLHHMLFLKREGGRPGTLSVQYCQGTHHDQPGNWFFYNMNWSVMHVRINRSLFYLTVAYSWLWNILGRFSWVCIQIYTQGMCIPVFIYFAASTKAWCDTTSCYDLVLCVFPLDVVIIFFAIWYWNIRTLLWTCMWSTMLE